MAEATFEHEAQVRAALHAIVSDPAHGADTLSSPQVMANLLKDFLPDAPRESGLLIAAAQARSADALRQHVSQGLDAATAIVLVSRSLGDSTAYGPQACDWATHELAVALGMTGLSRPATAETVFDAETKQALTPAHIVPPQSGMQGTDVAHEAETARPDAPNGLASPSGDNELASAEGTTRKPILAAPSPTELAGPHRQEVPAETEPARPPGTRRRAILIMLGSFAVVAAVIVAVILAAASKTPSGKPLSFGELSVGNCLSSGGGLNFTQSYPATFYSVPCRDQHIAEVFVKDSHGWPAASSWPGEAVITRQGEHRCNLAFSNYDGISPNQSAYTYAWSTPSSSSWPSGDRELTCIAYKNTQADPGGAPIYGSIRNSDK
jgi:Septum formation